MTFGWVTKEMFFDRARVVGAVDKAARKALSRFGAFVRRTAKSSIRKRKKRSAPGTPPSSHTGLLKRFIFFGYEAARRSVVIGPARLNSKVGDAPAALEYAGKSTAVASRRRGGHQIKVRIKARPFMHPAFEKEKRQLSHLWQDSVK